MKKVDVHNVKDRVVEALGCPVKAADWLKKPNRALAGRTPEQLVKHKSGRKRVLAVLGRIEHGIPS